MLTNEVLTTIKKRRSVRAFEEKTLADKELLIVLEAARYAPSASNKQLWHFTVIQNHETLSELNVRMKEGMSTAYPDNEQIQRAVRNKNYNVFYGASTVVIVSGIAECDCAAATQNMLLAAESIGVGSCWINVPYAFTCEDNNDYKERLGIPVNYNPFSSVALGYKKTDIINTPHRKENVVNYIR